MAGEALCGQWDPQTWLVHPIQIRLKVNPFFLFIFRISNPITENNPIIIVITHFFTSSKLPTKSPSLLTSWSSQMVLEQYLGQLRPPLLSIASRLSQIISRSGLSPPSEPALIDALLITFVLILLAFPFFLRPKKDPHNAVLILGISGERDAPAPGKTSLFTVLRHRTLPKHGTVPSMVVNDVVFAPSGTSQNYRWVDFPGHPRLRHQLPQYLQTAKCIVFVIDAATFTAHARKDALLLYHILTSPKVANHSIPILIFCNKSDLPNAAKIVTVKTRLEAELERAKTSHATTLQSADVGTTSEGDAEEESVYLGYENEAFTFEHTPGTVTFATGSAVSGDVQAIVQFAKSTFL